MKDCFCKFRQKLTAILSKLEFDGIIVSHQVFIEPKIQRLPNPTISKRQTVIDNFKKSVLHNEYTRR